ncbi:MAG TPA: transglycosylase domain-containing protein [Flavobacteriales bacterium]|nr:transglycosylase domain-containing protein [Flavobacteriales bacterium]
MAKVLDFLKLVGENLWIAIVWTWENVVKRAFRPVLKFSMYNWAVFRKRRWFIMPLSFIYTIFITVFLFFVAVYLNFLWMFGSMPSIDMVENPELAMASEVYSADGVLLGKYFSENREPIKYDQIGQNVINALVYTEDARFYKHYGIDPYGTAGAIIQTAKGDKRGGSTITQQLAKNLFKTRKQKSNGWIGGLPVIRTVVAKTKEWITALRLEYNYSKPDILMMYLNTVDFGHNTFGISVAAKTYFGVESKKLSIPQASMLIGMLKAPTTYSPLKHPDKCMERRNVVLGQLLKYEKITKAQYDKFIKEPLGINYKEYNYSEGIAPYFRTAVARYLKKWSEESGKSIYTGGLKIYTTLDTRFQKHAEASVAHNMKIIQARFKAHWAGQSPWMIKADWKNRDGFLPEIIHQSDRYKKLKKKFGKDEKAILAEMSKKVKMTIFTWDKKAEVEMSPIDSIKHYLTLLHCAMMTVDPKTGGVVAYVGGIDYNHFKYDHVSVAKNQPGSTFKPFVYTTAMEQGMGPCDRLPDAPITIRYTEKGKKKVWTPHNADWATTGTNMTLRHAMGRSVNTVTARLTEKVGWENVRKTAIKMGIKSNLLAVPSIGLGSNEVTLYELVGAYTVFMNKGMHTDPRMVNRITDMNGNLIAEFKPAFKRAIAEESAWLMTYMLRGGMEEPMGTSQALWSYKFVHAGNQVGGKTGTSSNYSDGWYMGVTSDYITGVWVGADDNRIRFRSSETGEGARTALPIFGYYMDLLYADAKIKMKKSVFPKEWKPIKREHNCRTFMPVVDSLGLDSLGVIPPDDEIVPVEMPGDENQ